MDVLHPSRPNVSRDQLSEKLAALYKTDKARVVTFGLRTQFGGGRSTGFALIYDDEASQKKFEPKYRLIRVRKDLLFFISFEFELLQSGLLTKVDKASRKLRKERKNRAKKVGVSCFLYCLSLTALKSSAVPKRRKLPNPPRRASKRRYCLLLYACRRISICICLYITVVSQQFLRKQCPSCIKRYISSSKLPY